MSGFLYIDFNNALLSSAERSGNYVSINIDSDRREELLNNTKPIVVQNVRFEDNDIRGELNSAVFNSSKIEFYQSVIIGAGSFLNYNLSLMVTEDLLFLQILGGT